MQRTAASTDRTLYQTPFSKAYWRQAAAEMKDTRMLVFAALIVALRVALKAVKIPIAASIDINTAFIANAFGAMVYGPVVALLGAAVSDTLGALLVPSGPYFFPFIFTEMAGSLIFALFLYRAEVSVSRLLLSRFCICFFVNIVMTEPIMVPYYEIFYTSQYAPFQVMRIAKNLMLFPVEAVILALIFRSLIPPFRQMGYLYMNGDRLKLNAQHLLLLVVLLAAGVASVSLYYNNVSSFSASYSAQERLQRNTQMNAWVAREAKEEEENLVTVIQSAKSKAFQPEMTYELAIYRLDWDQFRAREGTVDEKGAVYTLDLVRGYSKSPAAKDGALTFLGTATAVTNKYTEQLLTLDIRWENPPEEGDATP